MDRVYVAEVTERQSEKGGTYWRALLVQDGQRKVAYVWEPDVAKMLVAGRELLVELKQNGSRFPKVVKAEPLPSEPDVVPQPGLSAKDALIAKQTALKAAATLIAATAPAPADTAEATLALAERLYRWLVE
jgi:hypothetical protein